jgi:hypothetical protein
LWVPLADLKAMRPREEEDQQWKRTLAIDEPLRTTPEPQPRIARNVIVLAKPPAVRHPELTRVDSLGDRTALLIRKRSPAWVEWLKRTVPLDSVRLLPGHRRHPPTGKECRAGHDIDVRWSRATQGHRRE